MLSKNRLIQYRNASYFGQTLKDSYQHELRHGLGVLVSDCGSLVFGFWKNNVLNGKYYYSNSISEAYGYIKDGLFEGWNVLNDDDLVVWCECRAGLFHGNIVLKKGNYQPEAYQFNLGQQVKQISLLNMSDPVKTLVPGIQTNLQLFIDSIVNQQKYQSNIGAIKLPTTKYYGTIDRNTKSGEGLGFIFHRSKLSSIGFYKCNQLNGLGRRFNNGEIEDGIFSDGKLSNILFRINTKRNQYVKMDYSGKQTVLLQKGQGNGEQKISEMRQQFHIRSMNFNNDWIMMQDLIKVDLSSIKISRPEALKTRTSQLISKLAKQYLDSNTNPQNLKEKLINKKQSLSYLKTVQKSLTQKKIKVNQQYQSPEQIQKDSRYQKNLKVNQFSPVYKANLGLEDARLEDAIKQYEELQRFKTTLKR